MTARFQHAVEPAQHRDGQDHLAVLGSLVIAPQGVGDGRDRNKRVSAQPRVFALVGKGRYGVFFGARRGRLQRVPVATDDGQCAGHLAMCLRARAVYQGMLPGFRVASKTP